ESIATVEPLANDKNLALNNDVKSVVVEADKVRLLQVLNNLLTNAIKYSPKEGTVNISAEIKPHEIIFRVTDEGPGIPLEKAKALFQTYYQVDERDGKTGFGLGLAISRMIVDTHGGNVGAFPNDERGSTFWFSLPSAVDLTEADPV